MSTNLRDQLPALEDRIYLNTGTSGPVPLASFQAQVDLLQRFTNEGYATPDVREAYSLAVTSAREAVAGLLNCAAGEVVLTNSTSDGIGIVAQGLPWKPGDEIITSDLEHVSGIAPWLDAAIRHGARVVNLQSEGGHLTVEHFAEAISEHTKLICVSHLSWATGTVLPLKQICALARQVGALTLVDGAQSAGHIPIDVRDLDCDFYTVSGQKWVLGPEGTGALYVKKSALEHVAPTRIGWPSLEDHDAADGTLRFHPDARRFETGTVHAPAFAGLAQSITMLQAIGMDNVFDQAVKLSSLARTLLSALDNVTILSPAATPSGLLTFVAPDIDLDACVNYLWEEHRVIIRSIPGIDALRASFHVFNIETDVQALAEGFAQYLNQVR